ncbi:MAG: glycosyltransferase family 4 protein [Myxococcales bacterium]
MLILENWIDLARLRPRPRTTWRTEVGLGAEDFVCLYAGTMGYASGVDVLVEVAERLSGHSDVRLVCVGAGVLRERMEHQVQAKGLKNLLLLPFQPPERIAEFHSAADVALLTTAPGVGSSSVPSKLITYLATGRPVVCSAAPSSDMARLVAQEQVGEVVQPGAPDALAAAILKLQALSKAEREALGRRAREVAERRFSLQAALRRFERLFEDLQPPRAPPP